MPDRPGTHVGPRRGLALLPVTAAALDAFGIRKDERCLEAKFGDAYRAYRIAVRR